MNSLFVLCTALIVVPAAAQAYEKAFKATDPGEIEIKTIPARTLIVARRGENYFDNNSDLFGKLFRYIQDNDVSMTVPVKADINPGNMYFYIGDEDLKKELKSSGSVEVVEEPARKVMSLGVRGGYSEKNFNEAREELFNQLAVSKQWKKKGEAYAIFWDGPYVPGFMKKFEVHVPVVQVVSDQKEARE